MAKLLKVVTAVLLATGLFIPPAAAADPKLVLIYGDSVLYESAGVIGARFAVKEGWTYGVRAWPGTAPCFWLTRLKSDLAELHPDIVMLETMGNPVDPCLPGAGDVSRADYYKKYRADFDTYFDEATAAGARMIFIRPIPTASAGGNEIRDELSAIAATEAAKFHGVSLSTIRYYPLTTGGQFTPTKPCLQVETATNGCDEATDQIAVRSPDGVHLCPVRFQTTYVCPVYSSGELRYGSDIVHAALYPPPPVMP